MISAQEKLAKQVIKVLGFQPEDGSSSTWVKSYINHGNYKIKVDIEAQQINYGSKIILGDKTTCNFNAQENFVVLECVNRLLKKGYKPKNITLEKIYPSGHGHSGKLDICVSRNDGSEYLLIECKTWGKEFKKESAKMHKDGGQLFTYFKFSNKADIIMLYASELKGKDFSYNHQVIKIEDDYRTGDVKDFFDKWNKLTKNNGVFDEWVTPYHFVSHALYPQLLKTIRQEDSGFIFNRFLEILRHNVVSDKPNAFNKIFTLFLCKIYDEKTTTDDKELKFQWLEGKDDDISFQMRLADLYKNGMREFLEKEVTDFSDADFDKKYKSIDAEIKEKLREDIIKLRLEKNNEFAIKEVFDNKSFKENAKVVKQVVELLQGFKIRYVKKQQYLSDFFELLLTTGLKQESGQFFTPVPIAQFIIKSIPTDELIEEKLKKGEKNNLLPYVMDYAAGSGHFLTEMMHEVQRSIGKKDTSKYIADTAKKIKNWQEDHFDWALQYVYGIEKDYRLVKVGKVGCYLHGDGLANVIHSDGLGNFKNTEEYKGKLKERDSNFPKENKQFDMVVSNPPYSVQAFKQNARNYYTDSDFELYSSLTDNSSEIECLFIERTKQLLKDGGIAGIILPSSILSNTGIYTKTREIILQNFDIVAIAELGSNTFMATGTNTVTLFLRRKNNYDSINLNKSVEQFFTNLQDITLNKIEKPVSKYVAHTWESISFDDYKTLLQKQPNEAMQTHELYQEYQKKIMAKNEKEKWETILKIETEKLFYFIIAYPQKVVLVNSGEKKEEKQFLGYEFSNRRGSEGIHPIQRGKNIDECTKLFDADITDNPERASTYIYKAFQGDLNFKIDESLQKNVCRSNLVDMLTFDRVDFEKTISLSAKKKVKIKSKWDIVKLGIVCEINGGNGFPKEFQGNKNNKDIPFYKVSDMNSIINNRIMSLANNYISLHDIKNNIKVTIFQKNAVIFPKVGRAIDTNKKRILGCDACIDNNVMALKVKDENILNPYYLLNYFVSFVNLRDLASTANPPSISATNLSDFKIPLPPKDIQEKIVFEIEGLEQKESQYFDKIEEFKADIFNLMDNTVSHNKTKLENIAALLKRGKSPKYGSSTVQIIKSGQARGFKEFDFTQKHYVTENFILDDRKLEKGDILINSSGVGTAGRVTMFDLEGDFVVDSHITILRPDKTKALSDFILHSLAKIGFKNIETMAMGQSGQIELTIKTIQNIKIPLPSLSEQQKIVSQIKVIERKINVLQEKLSEIPKQKDAILKKYL